MDPNTALKEIRDILNFSRHGLAADDCERLSELFKALDMWLKSGGFLPDDWAR